MTKLQKYDLTIELLTAILAFVVSYFCAAAGAFLASGAVLLVSGCLYFAVYLKKSGALINPAAFFAISWLGGIGISCFKLSKLQEVWSTLTWICLLLIFVAFLLGYRLVLHFYESKAEEKPRTTANASTNDSYDPNGLLLAIHIVLILSVAALTLEAWILDYVPLFTVDTPHAYSYFHVSGVHYFTVSCVLIPSLSILYADSFPDVRLIALWKRVDLAICNLLALLIPILLVSRFQLLFAILLAVFTWLCCKRPKLAVLLDRRFWMIAASGFALLLVLYVFLTIERAHSVEYLNGIFEMKNARTPIYITQPYIYIANNFDNFNCLVEQLPEKTHGLRTLFPFFALTGMKFSHPELVSFPLYITREELTTVTLFYDAYYDFGAAGCVIMAFLLGTAGALLERAVLKHPGGFTRVFLYAQLCFYLLFAFFTTWFSNPATWFYVIATVSIGIFVQGYTKLLARRKGV